MKEKIREIQSVKTPYFVGSKGRPNFPLANFVVGLNLFVEPQEFSLYSSIHSAFNKIHILEKNNGGFAFLMNSIVKKSKEMGLEHFMFCDDDILGFSSREKGRVNLDMVFNEGVEIMKRDGLSQLSICFAGHDFYTVKDGIRVYKNKIYTEGIGAWTMFIGNVSDILSVGGYDESLPIFNDWDISANLVKNGKKIRRWNKYHFDHKMKSLKGGADFLYSKNEVLKKGEIMMREKYGDECIKTVFMHGQTEVRVKWKILDKKFRIK